MYEDDPIPLRVHDCSLDLTVVSDPKGMVCICHHYLYQVNEISIDSTTHLETANDLNVLKTVNDVCYISLWDLQLKKEEKMTKSLETMSILHIL